MCVRESVCAVGARRACASALDRAGEGEKRERRTGEKVLNTAAQWWHGWRAEIIERSARTDCSPKLVATALFNRLPRHVGHRHAIRLPSHRPRAPNDAVPDHARLLAGGAAPRAGVGHPAALESRSSASARRCSPATGRSPNRSSPRSASRRPRAASPPSCSSSAKSTSSSSRRGRAEDALHCLRNQLAPLEQRMAAEGCLPTAASSGVTNGSSHPSIHAASIAGSSARSSPAPTDGMLPPPGSNNSSVSNGKAASASPNARLGISVRELSAYLMCTNEELMRRTGWDGSQGKPSSSTAHDYSQAALTNHNTTNTTPSLLPSSLQGTSRSTLLSELQQYIPPALLLPENRLQTLLQQAVLWQSSQCAERPSAFGGSRALLEDFAFSREEIPHITKHVLERHTDEVWFVAYSHDGTKLATAAKDAVVAVWEVASMLSSTTSMAINPSNGAAVSLLAGTKMLCGHTDALCAIAWSPDDTHLLTCACDQLIKMWDVNSGECVQTFSRHTESVTAIAWLPDGNYFISAGVDKTVLLWGVASGAVLSSWTGSRVHNLAVNSHGTQLIAACERGIRVCPIETMSSETPTLTVTEELWIEGSEPITSLCLTKDGRHALVNTASQEIHLWELPSRSLIHRYIGHKQGGL